MRSPSELILESRLKSSLNFLDFDAQNMNVEGLTRDNVASHLQKYRLQLKREQE